MDAPHRLRLRRLSLVVVALLMPGNWVGSAVAQESEELRRIGVLLDLGAFAEAERQASALVPGPEVETGSSDRVALLGLLLTSKLRNGKAGDDNTLSLANRLVRLATRSAGPDSAAAATSLHLLGDVHFERGEFNTALATHRRALAIRTGHSAPEQEAIADSLERVVESEILLEQFASARKSLDRALAIRERHAAAAPLKLASALELSAFWSRYSGDYTAGLTLVDRAAEIRRQVFRDSPYTSPMLVIKGDMLFLRGELDRAHQVWAEGLQLSERQLDPGHPLISRFLRKLALVADAVGDRAETRRLLDQARRVGMPRLPPCHPELAGLLNDSAQLAQRDGNYADARRMYQQQLRMLEKCHTNANWLATALHNYANLFFEMGDLAEAERLHSRAVRVWSTRLGPRHTHVARGLDALAEVVAARGHHERSRGLYERALRIRRARTSEAQPDVAWTLTNLARTVAALGELKRAHDFVSEAIGIYRRQGAFDEPDHLARAFELQGTILARQGMMLEAGASATAALEERERIHGPDHPLTAESRTQLARIMFLTGERGTALTTALAADHTGREHLRFTVRYLPERQALAYAAKQPGALDLALSVAAAGTVDNTGALLDAVVRSRGVILEELARRTREFDVTDRQTLALRRTADHARQRYADLVVRSMGEPVSRAILEQARGEKEAAEEALAARSVEARRERLEDQAGLDEVRAALPPDSALVSIIKYERTLVPGARETGRVRRQPSYAAFVQRGADGGVAFVPLGPAEPLDALVNAWRDEAAGRSLFALPRGEAEKAYLVTAAKVRRALWDPLASQLSGFSQVFVVPDGLLNVLSIGSLPARTGGFIVEGETVLHYLSTERDLIRARADTAPAGLLAVGGASFEKPATVRSSTRSGAAPGCDQFRAMQFTNLPGTKREVDEISRLWNVHETGELTVLSGPSATESAVKSRLGNQRIVHLATHGFFLATECRFGATGTRGVGTIVPIAKPGAPVNENPLLLSGLALVGAGAGGVKRPDQDDGILTAEEIAGLQLQGTEWAVLSACNTGLGEIKSGEGVFGLRRAFQIAGARTVIMSLWSVDDDATREWMRALYEGRLERRLNTAQAVREASLTVLRARRAKRLTTHPFYWAAFVAAGDWR